MKIELISEDNKLLGPENSQTVHQEKLLHASVHGIITYKDSNSEEKYFIRWIPESSQIYPGYISTGIASHLEHGKRSDEIAIQKIKESNLEANLKYVGTVRVNDEYENEISFTYIGKSPEEYYNDNKEKFLTFEEIKKQEKVTPHLIKSIKLYLKNKK